MMSIPQIADIINSSSSSYRIGCLQEIRRRAKKLKNRTGDKIFRSSTVSEDRAFHFGGRKELQFNIGKEPEGLRYGVAFSLETSQSLPDVKVLFPKLTRFNQFILDNPDYFEKYEMWVYQNNQRSEIHSVTVIESKLYSPKTFIFIGCIQPFNEINIDQILETFDELLIPYVYVEGVENVESLVDPLVLGNDFHFEAKRGYPASAISYKSSQSQKDVIVRHTQMQDKLYEILKSEYGEENVSTEHLHKGNKIDVVLKQKDGYTFYEIKTAGTAKGCIREAMGQLIEYCYWPQNSNAHKLVVVGAYEIDSQTQRYLQHLNSRLNLNLEYLRIQI